MSEDDYARSRFAGLLFSQIKGCEIRDNTGVKIGVLQDAIFKESKHGFQLTKFLVGGTFWEEMLEDLGIMPDVDPVFPVSAMENVSAKLIQLNVTKDKLKSTTRDTDAIAEDEFKLSELSRFKLVDVNNEKIGNIIDITFSRDAFQFIVGDGFIRELAEDLGLINDVDLLLEVSFIEAFDVDSKTIRLNKDKLNLKTTFEKHIPNLNQDADPANDVYRRMLYFPRSEF
ncbi:MAG: hypothetical protein ACXAE3_11440 [Candidatus Kariarchaeaceae archaeon]